MNKREAIKWLQGMKFSCGTDMVSTKREALDMAISALETLEKLEKWMEDQNDD